MVPKSHWTKIYSSPSHLSSTLSVPSVPIGGKKPIRLCLSVFLRYILLLFQKTFTLHPSNSHFCTTDSAKSLVKWIHNPTHHSVWDCNDHKVPFAIIAQSSTCAVVHTSYEGKLVDILADMKSRGFHFLWSNSAYTSFTFTKLHRPYLHIHFSASTG